jgi:hypothetical protein
MASRTNIIENDFFNVYKLDETILEPTHTQTHTYTYVFDFNPESAVYTNEIFRTYTYITFFNDIATYFQQILGKTNVTIKQPENKIQIQCKTITSLKTHLSKETIHNKLSYNVCLNLFLEIGKLCKLLEEKGFVFPFFTLDMFYIIDDTHFFISDYNELHTIEKTSTSTFIEIKKPYKPSLFFSREFLSLKSLPSKLPSNMWMFSLAVCVVFCLTNNENVYMRSIPSYMKILESIEYTKLYYALLRCLELEHQKRIFFYI